MITSAREIPRDVLLQTDVCIVGAGAAGITLALELSESPGLNVTLLESGGYKENRSTSLFPVELINPANHYPIDEARTRLLGGTTSVWGGRCIPYDPIDFEFREYMPFSEWPVPYGEIEQYHTRAHGYCQCGEYSYELDKALPDSPERITETFIDGAITSRKIERWSMPTHFGRAFRERLKSRTNLKVILEATCRHIAMRPGEESVDSLSVRSTEGDHSFRVKAGTCVLAGGGLEVTRLLLASNDVHQAGIGNHSDCLGKFYMGHISGAISRVKFSGLPESNRLRF